MINKAIAHITQQAMEMNDDLSLLIEEHLTEICTNTRVAAKLLNEEKTLREIHEKMWDEARNRRKKGDGVYIKDAELYEMAEAYYEITEEDKQSIMQKVERSNIVDISNML